MQTIRQVLTIPNAGTDSPPAADSRAVGQAASITIIAPPVLTGVCTLQVANGSGGYVTAQAGSPPADIAFAAAKALVLPPIALQDFRIHSAAAEGAARDFVVLIQSYR